MAAEYLQLGARRCPVPRGPHGGPWTFDPSVLHEGQAAMKDVRKAKEWTQLLSIASRVVDEEAAAHVLAEIATALGDGDIPHALEWLNVAFLAVTTDEIGRMRAYLGRRAADPVTRIPLRGDLLLGALRDKLGDSFGERADASLENVNNLLARLAGKELPS